MSRGLNRAARLQRIEELLLGSTNGLRIQEIADSLGVHRTTIWRDVSELSTTIPIQQDGSRYLLDRSDYLSSIKLSRGESLMLYLALRRLMRKRTHLPKLLVQAMEKLSLALSDPSSAQLTDSIHVMRHEQPSDVEQSKIWEILVQAWTDCITVRLEYQDYRSSVIELLEIQPYLFEPAVLSDGVYLVGYSILQEKMTTLKVDRILSAALTTDHFVRPHDVVVDNILKHLWGIWYGEELTEVRLRFIDPVVGGRVRKTIWLPDQEIMDLPEGGIIWIARVQDVFELVPWIRGWGPECEVLEPEELRERIKEVEIHHGGITMATTDVPKTASFTDEFYASLMDIFDGERLKMCLQCSSCSGICPFGYLMDFHPRKMIAALRAGIFDDVMESDSIWMCVSCYACTEVCPAKIPITAALMTRTKEEMLLAGNVPPELQDALENSQRYGNPLGESPRKRADWAKDLDIAVPILAKEKRPVEVLWFVGDYPSYHPRIQVTTKAFAKILQALEVDFGILGPEEQSDGDSQRLAGEKGLFEMLAEKNGEAFKKYEFTEIITTDPHAYNAIKNEYPALGYSFPVRHYTEFLADRIDDLKPLLKNEVNATITFHDPCYLGRVNSIYDEPRELLQAIPGVELVEMTHSRENSLCCGGGGGGMWLDGFQWEKAHVRLAEWRVREAVTASGADNSPFLPPIPEKKKKAKEEPLSNGRTRILAVACPYEAPRFEDAVKTVEEASELVVKDIAELIVESMGL